MKLTLDNVATCVAHTMGKGPRAYLTVFPTGVWSVASVAPTHLPQGSRVASYWYMRPDVCADKLLKGLCNVESQTEG